MAKKPKTMQLTLDIDALGQALDAMGRIVSAHDLKRLDLRSIGATPAEIEAFRAVVDAMVDQWDNADKYGASK